MRIAIEIARAVVPRHARRYVRELQHRDVFDAAVRGLLCLPPEAELPHALARQLLQGWANETMSPSAEYLQAVWRHAARTPGPILECGSGLTTLVLGVAARAQGRGVWSLEHDRFWARTIRAALQRYGVDGVRVCLAPLRNYGAFSWYDPQCALPADFSLVLCDGPPGTTPGGRYGLMPVLGLNLRRGCVVLLDDATRVGEQAVLAQWQREMRTTHTVRGRAKPYAEVVVATLPAARPANQT
ncbi:MAG TPA: hypothetical protein VFR86_03145 [Burkholderiaceae bacterium]|nr:hypothetical protein [Burkholderiaceae bacterium]